MSSNLKKIFFIFFSSLLFLQLQTQSNAVFNGQDESGYESAGYMMIDVSESSLKTCGITYISSTVGISAAHCLEDDNYRNLYPSSGEFVSRFEENSYTVESTSISPKYSVYQNESNAGDGDISIINLSETVNVNDFAEISTPNEGCGYTIVGYGRNEDGDLLDRRSIDLCIEKVEKERFEIKKADQHFCIGDSGSAVFKTDTNIIVGIVSTIVTDTDCTEADAFYASRIDTNTDLLENNTDILVTPSPRPTFPNYIVNADPAPELDFELIGITIFVLTCIACTGMLLVFILFYLLFMSRKKNAPVQPNI